jgi:hypothetical protein
MPAQRHPHLLWLLSLTLLTVLVSGSPNATSSPFALQVGKGSPPSGQFGTKKANNVFIGGFVSGIDENALVYYPDKKGTYPLVRFGL